MKRFYTLILVIVTFSTQDGLAQYENVWAFGGHAGLDFNNGGPRGIVTSLETLEGCASICDYNGKLMFYTDGSSVWDSTHNLMPNGSNITNIAVDTPFFRLSTPTMSTRQAAVIVPLPEDRHKFYIFSLSHTTGTNIRSEDEGMLLYSVVDMSLNNGLGDIVSNKKGVLLDSNLNEQMTTVPGLDCDVWLLVSTISSDFSERVFKTYNISTNGIDHPVLTRADIGFTPWPPNPFPTAFDQKTIKSRANSLTVSSNFEKVASSTIAQDLTSYRPLHGTVTLFDFNRNNGTLTNPIIILQESVLAACFSPDDSKLYCYPRLNDGIVQINIISDSPTVIDPNVHVLNTRTSSMKLGPDGKIYLLNGLGRTDVINNPNNLGASCNIQESIITYPPRAFPPNKFVSLLPNRISLPIGSDTFVSSQFLLLGCEKSLNLSPYNINGWGYKWNDGNDSLLRTIDAIGVYWVGYHADQGYCNYEVDTFYVSEVATCFNGNTGRAYVNKHTSDPNKYDYIWMNASLDTISNADTLDGVPAGKYYVWVTSSQNSSMACFEIEAISEMVNFDPSALVACQGDTVDFRNTSSSYFTTFEWQKNGDSISDALHLKHTFTNAGNYNIRLIGRGKVCIDTFSKTIVVDSMLTGTFQVEPSEICVGQLVSFYPSVDSSATGIRWTFSEAASRKEISKTRSYQHAFDRAGVLPITMHTQFRACPDTSYTDSLIIYPLPEVDLGRDSSICLHGAPIYLRNLREAPLNPHHYLWNTGDTNATLKVVHPGTYTLSIKTEPIGCTTTESIAITKDCYIDVPNAFTPNGDGYNDFFFPRQLLSESVSRFHMQVFNRWGQLVFETKSPDGRGWDGRFNGQAQPVGVYLYRIEVDFGENRKPEQYEGNVTLIR